MHHRPYSRTGALLHGHRLFGLPPIHSDKVHVNGRFAFVVLGLRLWVQ